MVSPVPPDEPTLTTMRSHTPRAGFTLVELVVVLLFLALLAGALVPRVTDRLAWARDARRLDGALIISEAVEQYHLDHGAYPVCGGDGSWNQSDQDEFIPVLVEEGYLEELPRDPLNNAHYHYRYYVYDQGAAGCSGDSEFYVLGIRGFETAEFKAKHPGYFKCSARDWSNEFAWVTGGGVSEQ